MTKHKWKLEDPPPTADNKRTKKEEGAAEDRPVGGMINIVGAPVGFAFGPVLKSQHAEAHGWSQARLDEVDRSKYCQRSPQYWLLKPFCCCRPDLYTWLWHMWVK